VLCVIAIGLVVTMGLMRVVNLAHGAFAAIGGYIAVILMTEVGLPFFVSIACAVAAITAFSVLVERAFFVHLYGASELDQLLLTIGLDFLVVGGLTIFFGPNVFPMKLPPDLAGSVDLGFREFEVYRLTVIGIGAVVVTGLWIGLECTNIGAQLRAAVDNRSMAQATGINVPRLFSLTFATGSGLAALGGAIGAPMLPLEPLYPFKYLVLVLVVVALSGYGNIRASIAVAMIVGIAETAGRYFVPQYGAFVLYVVIIVMMMWRKDGLFAGRAA
jgi:branched-chain amino acid transport system permease protein